MASAAPQQASDEMKIVWVDNALVFPGGSSESMIREKLNFINALERERDGPTADFEIVCAGKSFKVHGVVIGIHSDYLKRRCERALRETGEYRIELKDVPPAAVKAMIDYTYTFDYSDPVVPVPAVPIPTETTHLEPRSILEAHSQIFTLGEMYDMEGLSDLALTKFSHYMKAGVPDDKAQVAMEAFFSKRADELIPATEHMYKNFTDDDRMHEAATALWSTSSFREHTEREDFEALLAAVPMFATELIDAMACEKGSWIGKRRPTD